MLASAPDHEPQQGIAATQGSKQGCSGRDRLLSKLMFDVWPGGALLRSTHAALVPCSLRPAMHTPLALKTHLLARNSLLLLPAAALSTRISSEVSAPFSDRPALCQPSVGKTGAKAGTRGRAEAAAPALKLPSLLGKPQQQAAAAAAPAATPPAALPKLQLPLPLPAGGVPARPRAAAAARQAASAGRAASSREVSRSSLRALRLPGLGAASGSAQRLEALGAAGQYRDVQEEYGEAEKGAVSSPELLAKRAPARGAAGRAAAAGRAPARAAAAGESSRAALAAGCPLPVCQPLPCRRGCFSVLQPPLMRTFALSGAACHALFGRSCPRHRSLPHPPPRCALSPTLSTLWPGRRSQATRTRRRPAPGQQPC
jgi:hypothetical protein